MKSQRSRKRNRGEQVGAEAKRKEGTKGRELVVKNGHPPRRREGWERCGERRKRWQGVRALPIACCVLTGYPALYLGLIERSKIGLTTASHNQDEPMHGQEHDHGYKTKNVDKKQDSATEKGHREALPSPSAHSTPTPSVHSTPQSPSTSAH
ncbi:hypothetical protein C8R45DRAFT_928139 [Mycena sanguinolenta]|nr:hypothetical protein C8R45DRAFT_928139 [Mycena sanguinolenta]